MKRSWKTRHPVFWGSCVVCAFPLVLLGWVICGLCIGISVGATSTWESVERVQYLSRAIRTIRRIRTVRRRRKQIFG